MRHNVGGYAARRRVVATAGLLSAVLLTGIVPAVAHAEAVAPAPPAAPTASVVPPVPLPPAPAPLTNADAQSGAVAAILTDAAGRPRLLPVTAPTVAEASARPQRCQDRRASRWTSR